MAEVHEDCDVDIIQADDSFQKQLSTNLNFLERLEKKVVDYVDDSEYYEIGVNSVSICFDIFRKYLQKKPEKINSINISDLMNCGLPDSMLQLVRLCTIQLETLSPIERDRKNVEPSFECNSAKNIIASDDYYEDDYEEAPCEVSDDCDEKRSDTDSDDDIQSQPQLRVSTSHERKVSGSLSGSASTTRISSGNFNTHLLRPNSSGSMRSSSASAGVKPRINRTPLSASYLRNNGNSVQSLVQTSASAGRAKSAAAATSHPVGPLMERPEPALPFSFNSSSIPTQNRRGSGGEVYGDTLVVDDDSGSYDQDNEFDSYGSSGHDLSGPLHRGKSASSCGIVLKSSPETLQQESAKGQQHETQKDNRNTSSSAAGIAEKTRTVSSSASSVDLNYFPVRENHAPVSESRIGKSYAWIRNGRWTQGPLIGSGSFGEVYKGLADDDGTHFAVKILQIKNKSEQTDELLLEIELIKTLGHPNIVKYYGTHIDKEKCNIHIFMEWMSGGSLSDIIKGFGGYLQVGTIRSYSRQILSGLAYLHENKVIHRDIKAGNILCDHIGNVKLADFGASAKIKGEQTQNMSAIKVSFYALSYIFHSLFSILYPLPSTLCLLYVFLLFVSLPSVPVPSSSSFPRLSLPFIPHLSIPFFLSLFQCT